VGPRGDAAQEAADAEAGISDSGSCSVASMYFQPASPTCLPCIESFCCMGLIACTSNTGCQTLLVCAQSSCDAGSAASCLANCEASDASDTEAVIMAYAQLATCISVNCQQCPALPPQPALSDL
jgi:hypothetical protein